MAEEPPKPLGLDRLSLQGISVLEEFIKQNVSRLVEPFYEELFSMADRDKNAAREKLSALATSEHRSDRQTVCHIIGEVANRDPDFCYPL